MSPGPAKRLERIFPLWTKQADFLDCTSTVKGFAAGQGAGKTRIGAYDLLCRVKPGRLYICTAPTYKMLRDATCRTFEAIARYLHVLKRPPAGENFSALVWPFKGGKPAEVLFRSTEDPDRLRGPNASGVWMDEASLSPYEAYQILIARLREGGELGFLTATFTPKGRSHWSYAEVFGSPRPGVTLIQAATRENPFLSEDFVDTVEANYAGLLAAQELGGEFVSVEGAEWPPEYFPDSIWFDTWPGELICKTIALDPSKGREAKSGDYAAFAILGVDPVGTLWVECHLTRNHTAESLAAQAVEYSATWLPDAFAVETNQFQQLLATLISLEAAKRGIIVPTVPVDNRVPKIVRIRRIGPYLMAGRIRFRNTPSTRLAVDQLREFPESAFDDAGDSIEMAIRVAADLLVGAGRAEPDSVVLT